MPVVGVSFAGSRLRVEACNFHSEFRIGKSESESSCLGRSSILGKLVPLTWRAPKSPVPSGPRFGSLRSQDPRLGPRKVTEALAIAASEAPRQRLQHLAVSGSVESPCSQRPPHDPKCPARFAPVSVQQLMSAQMELGRSFLFPEPHLAHLWVPGRRVASANIAVCSWLSTSTGIRE